MEVLGGQGKGLKGPDAFYAAHFCFFARRESILFLKYIRKSALGCLSAERFFARA